VQRTGRCRDWVKVGVLKLALMSNNKKPLGSDHIIAYKLERIGTEMGVGWFSCIPEKQPDFEKGLEYSLKHPNDQFMHKHLL